MKRLLWCYVAFKLYLWLPFSQRHDTRYGRFMLWLLEYGGAYAYSNDYRWFRDNAFRRS